MQYLVFRFLYVKSSLTIFNIRNAYASYYEKLLLFYCHHITVITIRK